MIQAQKSAERGRKGETNDWVFSHENPGYYEIISYQCVESGYKLTRLYGFHQIGLTYRLCGHSMLRLLSRTSGKRVDSALSQLRWTTHTVGNDFKLRETSIWSIGLRFSRSSKWTFLKSWTSEEPSPAICYLVHGFGRSHLL